MAKTKPTQRTYKIRMKPGRGQMLIKREWQLFSGEITDVRPVNPDDRENVIDTFLGARQQDSAGNWSEGPFAVVTEHQIRHHMAKDGTLSALDDKDLYGPDGQEVELSDEARSILIDCFPGNDRLVPEDCPFEVVQVNP